MKSALESWREENPNIIVREFNGIDMVLWDSLTKAQQEEFQKTLLERFGMRWP